MTADTRPDLTDQLLERYCDWRNQCVGVRAAYQRLTVTRAADRTLAFAAYAAALDREESAADAYANQIRRLSHAVSPADPSIRSVASAGTRVDK
jgi:capsule polysaccharide export protein KpsE/RkpR